MCQYWPLQHVVSVDVVSVQESEMLLCLIIPWQGTSPLSLVGILTSCLLRVGRPPARQPPGRVPLVILAPPGPTRPRHGGPWLRSGGSLPLHLYPLSPGSHPPPAASQRARNPQPPARRGAPCPRGRAPSHSPAVSPLLTIHPRPGVNQDQM